MGSTNASTLQRSLRDLLEIEDNHRFRNNIFKLISDLIEFTTGLDHYSTNTENPDQALSNLKRKLFDCDTSIEGHFRNHLQMNSKNPEFIDYIECWFPEDGLRIEYSRGGDDTGWPPITQGSQGQRSAALLDFLLAFGNEPLILDQPEDDLDNHLIYDLIVRQIRENKLQRQPIIVTHNPNVVVNGDAEMVHALGFRKGQFHIFESGSLQDKAVREEVFQVMEGDREALSRRWARLGRDI